MGKEVRFAQLVAASGRPQTLTLWTDPKKNPQFMKAVKENRVVTIVQKPREHQKGLWPGRIPSSAVCDLFDFSTDTFRDAGCACRGSKI